MKKELLFFFAGLVLIFASCRKEQFNGTTAEQQSAAVSAPDQLEAPYCYNCDQVVAAERDTAETPTILGEQVVNPYTRSNISEAYHNIFGNYPADVPVTHLYIKFTPGSFEELARLADAADSIELFDYPLDREVVYEGDYYLPPGYSAADIPPYYAVVPADFNFPSVPYEILEEMFIPDDAPALEDEALSLTGNLGEDHDTYEERKQQRIQYYQRYPPPCDLVGPGWNPDGCTPSDGGGTWEHCENYPKGKILVETVLNGGFTDFRPVRQAIVVIRRLFKVSTVQTDNQGVFQSIKYFPNKFTILSKFKNQYAEVSRMGFGLNQQFFPLKINWGTWSHTRCGQEYRIMNPHGYGTKATSQWAGAVAHNGVLEQREMCQQEGVGTPPEGLHIMLSKKKSARNGNTYMYHKILDAAGPLNQILGDMSKAIDLWQPNVNPAAVILDAWKFRAPDILYGFGENETLPTLAFLNTDQYCELVYHELSHASHYSAAGVWFWVELGTAELRNPGPGSYGSCCTQYSPIIALSEGWAYHMGHYLSDKKWGLLSTTFPEQGDFENPSTLLYFSNGGGFSSHVNFLEGFNPLKIPDPNRWIPKGLLNDLIDNLNENIPVSDAVSGYTNYMFYRALEPDVRSITEFKNRLLVQNGFWQQSNVISLFADYGY